MVAGGTGLSAFLGMLDDMSEKKSASYPVQLYYGVTNVRDLCEIERLNGYRGKIDEFQLETVVMNAADGWTGKTGLLPEHFDQSFLKSNGFDMYVCGPPPMVEAIKTWLEEQRIQDYRLFYEKFGESNSR
jgi:anthranilate 1,2-dioxygenase reductase subunit